MQWSNVYHPPGYITRSLVTAYELREAEDGFFELWTRSETPTLVTTQPTRELVYEYRDLLDRRYQAIQRALEDTVSAGYFIDRGISLAPVNGGYQITHSPHDEDRDRVWGSVSDAVARFLYLCPPHDHV